MTRANTLKLVDHMPDKIPVKELIEIFRKLDKMEEQQAKKSKDIDWKRLKEEVSNWSF